MDAACDHLAEYRLAGEFRVGMKPLRVIGAGEIKYLLPGNRSFPRFSAFSYLEILKRAVRHDGHKGLFTGHRADSFTRSTTARARPIPTAAQTFIRVRPQQTALPPL